MSTDHRPDPAFVDHLEWQLRSALRRRDRFAEPAGRSVKRGLRTVVLVAVSLLTGAAGVMATQEDAGGVDPEQRKLVTQRAELRLRMANQELEEARRQMSETQTLHDQGVLGVASLTEAQLWLARVDLDHARRALELEEVQASGLPPRDELTAPAVQGRDFVAARLKLDQLGATQTLEAARKHAVRLGQLAEAGAVPAAEVSEADLAVARGQAELDLATARLDIRARFVRGEVPAQRVEAHELEAAARMRLRVLELEIEETKKRLARLGEPWASRAQTGGLERRLRRLNHEHELVLLELGLLARELGQKR